MPATPDHPAPPPANLTGAPASTLDTNDASLLRAYAASRSEPAFATFVHRHLPFVYATALRRVAGNTHLAEEIAQHVFTRAAQKSAALARHPAINAWLHTATRYAATDLVRREQRRRARELAAHTLDPDMHANAPATSDPSSMAAVDWEKLRPELDAALDHLRETDRAAVLLRFFENHPFATIGAKLHLTEDAARKRTDRALEKLRAHLARRGLTSTSAALSLALAQNASASAPAGLAATITTTALSASAPTAVTGLLSFLAMTKLQTGAILTLALASTLGTAFLATLAAHQHDALSAISRAPDATHAQTLETLRAQIADTEAALAQPRAESQKRAAAQARQLRSDENEIRGPAALFSDRLMAEQSLLEFLQEHPLDPVTREKLKTLLIEEDIAQREYRVKTLREKQASVFFNPDIADATQQKIRQLLGDPLHHAYREITLARSALREPSYDLKDAGVPLSDAQLRTVAHHYYETILRPESPPQLLLPSGLLPQEETFLERIAPHLSAQQTATLRATFQNENRIREARLKNRD